MTVPARTGSITQIQNSSTSDSQSVTVPSDAVLCIVAAAAFTYGGVDFSSLTLDGEGFTQVNAYQNVGAESGDTVIWRLTNPSTGSQTLAWTWDAALTEGANIFVVFYKDVDTTSPITGSATGTASNGSSTSGSFSSSTNDLCLCVGYSYDTTDCDGGYGANQSEIADSTVFNSCQGALGEKAGVSGTTTMQVGGAYTSIVACSIAGTSGTEYQEGVAGSLPMSGIIARTASLGPSGSITPTGAIVRVPSKFPSGSITPAGALARQTSLSGLSGSLGLAGTLAKQALIAIAGALGLSGIAARAMSKTPTGSTTPTGALSRQAVLPGLTGTLGLAGLLESVKTTLLSIAGVLGLAGAIVRDTSKAPDGSIAPVGSLVRQTDLPGLAGTLGLAGLLESVKTTLQAVAGALAMSGSLQRTASKPLAGTLGLVGGLTLWAMLVIGGTLGLSGERFLLVVTSMAGVLGLSGALDAILTGGAYVRLVSGVLGLSGTVSRRPALVLAGVLGLVGGTVIHVALSMVGVLTLSGSLVPEMFRQAGPVIRAALAGLAVRGTVEETAAIQSGTNDAPGIGGGEEV